MLGRSSSQCHAEITFLPRQKPRCTSAPQQPDRGDALLGRRPGAQIQEVELFLDAVIGVVADGAGPAELRNGAAGCRQDPLPQGILGRDARIAALPDRTVAPTRSARMVSKISMVAKSPAAPYRSIGR